MSTSLPQPFDLRGVGLFEGQYGIALFSRFPILKEGIRSFEGLFKQGKEWIVCLFR